MSVNKVFASPAQAVKDIPDGSVIMLGNFAGPGGTAYYLINALKKQGAREPHDYRQHRRWHRAHA